MEPTPIQPESLPKVDLSFPSKPTNPEVMSLEECKEYLGKYNLSDERILEIRNNLVGIVDHVLNAYLNDFR